MKGSKEYQSSLLSITVFSMCCHMTSILSKVILETYKEYGHD